MNIIRMEDWLLVGFRHAEGVDLFIYGNVFKVGLDEDAEGFRGVAMLPVESFEAFTPKAFTKESEIHLGIEGEMISISGHIRSPEMDKDAIIWALVNEPLSKDHYDIREKIRKHSFCFEYAIWNGNTTFNHQAEL